MKNFGLGAPFAFVFSNLIFSSTPCTLACPLYSFDFFISSLSSPKLVRKREIEASATPPPVPPPPASVEGKEGEEEGAAAAAEPTPAPTPPPAPLKYSSRKIFQFVHEIVSALASSGYPDLSLKLFLQVSSGGGSYCCCCGA